MYDYKLTKPLKVQQFQEAINEYAHQGYKIIKILRIDKSESLNDIIFSAVMEKEVSMKKENV